MSVLVIRCYYNLKSVAEEIFIGLPQTKLIIVYKCDPSDRNESHVGNFRI